MRSTRRITLIISQFDHPTLQKFLERVEETLGSEYQLTTSSLFDGVHELTIRERAISKYVPDTSYDPAPLVPVLS